MMRPEACRYVPVDVELVLRLYMCMHEPVSLADSLLHLLKLGLAEKPEASDQAVTWKSCTWALLVKDSAALQFIDVMTFE